MATDPALTNAEYGEVTEDYPTANGEKAASVPMSGSTFGKYSSLKI